MKQTVFIHTNNKQKLGALLAKYAIESQLPKDSPISVQFINVDESALFKEFVGTHYLFTETEERVYTKEDLQSFTLSRFMPPELMGYQGKAVVIDPDIFALTDITPLFAIDLGPNAIGACRKKTAWDTSVMLLDCSKLKHWSMESILTNLKNRKTTYSEVMTLKSETSSIYEISRVWNHLDTYSLETKIIHMTGRLTQPWKTGLPIDFTRNKMSKLFGIIPREPLYAFFGRNETTYQPHPNKAIEELFFTLTRKAVAHGSITKEDIQHEIDEKHVRPDVLRKI